MGHIEVDCPACQKLLQLSEAHRGRKVRCPSCDAVFMVQGNGHDGHEPPAAPAPSRRTAPPTPSATRPSSAVPSPRSEPPDSAPSRTVRRRKTAVDPWSEQALSSYEGDDESAEPSQDPFSPTGLPARRRSRARPAASGRWKTLAMFVILGLFMAGTLGGGGFLVVRFLREFGGMGSAGNVADLSYMPDYIEGFVVVRLAEVLKSPVIEALSARIPQAQAAVLDSNSVIPLKASDIDTVTFGFWRSHVASPLMPAFGTMNPWAGPSIGTGSMCVARLLKPVDPLTLGASRPTEHNGATIYPLGGLAIWMPDPQTVVIGFPVDVEAAIDRPEPESRFQKFDFAGRGGHFQIVAVNEQQPTQMSAWQASGQMVPFVIPPGMPPSMVALQKLPESFRIKSRGGSLRLDFSSRIEARIAIACREAPLASELQQELQSALSGLLPELEKLAGNPMLQQMLAPARSILNSVNVTQSGDAVNVQLQIEESVIEQAMQSLP